MYQWCNGKHVHCQNKNKGKYFFLESYVLSLFDGWAKHDFGCLAKCPTLPILNNSLIPTFIRIQKIAHSSSFYNFKHAFSLFLSA